MNMRVYVILLLNTLMKQKMNLFYKEKQKLEKLIKLIKEKTSK